MKTARLRQSKKISIPFRKVTTESKPEGYTPTQSALWDWGILVSMRFSPRAVGPGQIKGLKEIS